METTLDLPAIEDQQEFNLRRWREICADPALNAIEGRVETDRFGQIIMTPSAGFSHSDFESDILTRLNALLSCGKARPECPISTSGGVRAADVAWISDERLKTALQENILVQAPEICVEVLSRSNTRNEITEKKRLYFEGGAEEVWICDLNGGMHFFGRNTCDDELGASAICPGFPERVSS